MVNGARGWEFHPASMALQAIVCSRPPKPNTKLKQKQFQQNNILSIIPKQDTRKKRAFSERTPQPTLNMKKLLPTTWLINARKLVKFINRYKTSNICELNMPYCENCGSQVNPNAKFCSNCGASRNQATTAKPPITAQPTQPKRERLSYYSPPSPTATPSPSPPIMQPSSVQAPVRIQPAPVMPLAGSEVTVGVILFRKPKSLGRWDTYTGVVTSQRLIFAQMTSEMLKVAVQQSRDQAKAEGKGFFGQWSDQLKATFGYSKKYLTMPPQAILAETPGNFELYNNAINEIKVKVKRDQEDQVHDLEVEIHSTQGKLEFHMDENSNFVNLLKQMYGDRVKMPFGYFSKSININL